jgi:putative spermidine/putrescine transport system permease protein
VPNRWREPAYLTLAIFGLVVVFFLFAPMLIVIPMSVSDTPTIQFPPQGFTLRWYGNVFSDDQWSKALLNSLVVATATAIVASVFGTLAALGIRRSRFRGRKAIVVLLLSPLAVPLVIIAIGMYFVYVRWKVTGSAFGLILADVCLTVPFVLINVLASLTTLDRNLELAAMNLGASRWKTFRHVTLPIILPGVLAGGLFAFIQSWDEVVISLFLTTATFRTLPVQMWGQVRTQVDPTIAAVATTLFVVTTAVLLLIVRVRGVRT